MGGLHIEASRRRDELLEEATGVVVSGTQGGAAGGHAAGNWTSWPDSEELRL
jgi:hypothetical protein